jgi:hypothetical protein
LVISPSVDSNLRTMLHNSIWHFKVWSPSNLKMPQPGLILIRFWMLQHFNLIIQALTRPSISAKALITKPQSKIFSAKPSVQIKEVQNLIHGS